MTTREELLRKYYDGETTLEEEKVLKELFSNEIPESAEKDFFGYFRNEGKVPVDLEEQLFNNIAAEQKRGKTIRLKIVSWLSAAAVVLIILGVYTGYKKSRNAELENQFFTMEQALYRISESIQPQPEQEEMLVLWVDNNVEIIIN